VTTYNITTMLSWYVQVITDTLPPKHTAEVERLEQRVKALNEAAAAPKVAETNSSTTIVEVDGKKKKSWYQFW